MSNVSENIVWDLYILFVKFLLIIMHFDFFCKSSFYLGLPWCPSGGESAYQFEGHGFDP